MQYARPVKSNRGQRTVYVHVYIVRGKHTLEISPGFQFEFRRKESQIGFRPSPNSCGFAYH